MGELSRPSHRRLVSILSLEAGRRIGTERLIDMFWGEDAPDGAKASLQTHISALRKVLGPESIVTEGYGYRLSLDGATFDVLEFDEAAANAGKAASALNWEAVFSSSSAGLGLWRGQPYAELQDDEFARAAIVRLQELHVELWEFWAETLLTMGRTIDVLPELERLVVDHPLRERLWEHLMTARYRLGRHAEALRAFNDFSGVLAEIGLEPGPSIRRLEERILLHSEELTSIKHNLPADLTNFIGRNDELKDLAKLLAEHRLITLTGVGGSGKTRLALRAATDHLNDYPDGCWFVSLADLRDAELIPIEVAGALGLRPQGEDPLDAITASVSGDTILVVLDNCEHLREGAAEVARALLKAGGGVKVIATSREPLHVPGEVAYEVPPLSAPPPSAAMTDLLTFDSVRLFEDRAALADPRLLPDDESYALMASICRRLDGIPLAIELVAAKTRSLGLQFIHHRLEERVFSLTEDRAASTPRHQTLEAAIGWSYELLDEEEQRLLTRISVFRGGFDLAMVEYVAADDSLSRESVVRHLESLIEKSLISRERSVSSRFRLLETVREFAENQLREAGKEAITRRRHLDWCIGFARDLQESMYGAGRQVLESRLQLESDNLQASLETAQDESDEAAVTWISSALAWHWQLTGNTTGAKNALLRALSGVGEDARREAEMRARLAHSHFLLNQGERALAEAMSAHRLVEDLGPSVEKATVFSRLANLQLLLIDQDPRRSLPLAREAVSVAKATGDAVAKIRAEIALGQTLGWIGDVDEALEILLGARDHALRLGDESATITAYNFLFDIVYLHPTKRRDMPRQIMEAMVAQFPLDRWRDWLGLQLGWFPYVHMQTGEWEESEEANRRLRERRIEGYDHIWYLMTHGTLSWMRGDLEEASRAVAEIERIGVNPRWYHDYYPLRADIAADSGDIEATRSHAEAYLSVSVDSSEEAKKLGVLNPLVRAEVNAALSTIGVEHDEHVARAESAVQRAEAILEEFPPLSEGSLGMETHGTHLTVARAELSRLTGPDPELWREAAERADYIYFRLYSRVRYAEALGQVGDRDGARREIAFVHEESSRIGARGLKRLLDTPMT